MSSHNAVPVSGGVYKLQALDRAFAVLDLLAASNTPLGLAEIAAASGPSFRVTMQKIPHIADRLMSCVKGIQQDLGYTPLSR